MGCTCNDKNHLTEIGHFYDNIVAPFKTVAIGVNNEFQQEQQRRLRPRWNGYASDLQSLVVH